MILSQEEVSFIVVTHISVFWKRVLKKMRLNELGRRKAETKNSIYFWQYAKLAGCVSNIF